MRLDIEGSADVVASNCIALIPPDFEYEFEPSADCRLLAAQRVLHAAHTAPAASVKEMARAARPWPRPSCSTASITSGAGPVKVFRAVRRWLRRALWAASVLKASASIG